MTREEREAAIAYIKSYRKLDENLHNTALKDSISYYATAKCLKYWDMAIKALSQESEIEENIIKYMKKYPNHVGNTDFWEGFYACRNVVLQLDDEEYSPKEQEPCDDLISREDAFEIIASNDATDGTEPIFTGRQVVALLSTLPSVTQKCEKCAMNGSGSKYCDNCGTKSGKWIDYSDEGYVECPFCGHATNCEDDIDELHYCFFCGARMESNNNE